MTKKMFSPKKYSLSVDHPPASLNDPYLGDLRFRSLLSEKDWVSLPLSIRQRFSKRLADGQTIVYVGQVTKMFMSKIGFAFAQCVRLIGASLPTACDENLPGIVTVTEDIAHGGQVWTRIYARHKGFPQVIHSSKRFSGPTGLEEHVGGGVGMTLTVSVEDGALYFKSERYFIEWGRFRFNLPHWMSPGNLTVTHQQHESYFTFALTIEHSVFGLMLHQQANFEEVAALSHLKDDKPVA